MNKPIVRCRCGHQVLSREVLRLEPYERASGREYVYAKYRCRRCKRMGEAFIPETQWDWSIFAAPKNEMSEAERDHFIDEATISSGDVLSFHRALEGADTLKDLAGAPAEAETPRVRPKNEASKNEAPRGVKNSEKGNGETPSNIQRKPGA